MYTITYSYFKRNPKNFDPVGMRYEGYVYGKTIVELNKNYQKARDNHDVFKYTQMNFCSIEGKEGE